jgi:VCBS repeat-containing protein
MVTLNSNGSFNYTPIQGYRGPDSFTYKANDGTVESNVATVALTVSDTPPVATNDSYGAVKNTALNIAAPGVLGNNTDADGDALTAIEVGGPSHGTLALNSNGSFIYTPIHGYSGPDSFTYKANDGTADSNVATVAIAVTDTPPVASDHRYSVASGAVLDVSAPGVLGNDTDANGDALSAIEVAGPSHGTLALNADGSFSYTPAQGYGGPDSFAYKANDGTADSNVATVAITVQAAPPHLTGIANLTHSKKGLTAIILGFDEAMNRGSVESLGLYRVAGAVKARKQTMFTKPVGITGATYDSSAHTVTINLSKPFKGLARLFVNGTVASADGASSSISFSSNVQ